MTESRIWLDNASSTPLAPEVAEAMAPWLRPGQGANPSSVHAEGRAARRAIEDVRDEMADFFHIPSTQVHFTASATEANNLALSGSLRALPTGGRPHTVIASAVEHDSICQCLLQQEQAGIAEITWVPANREGSVDLSPLRGASMKPALAALMHVNNETGAVQPIGEWGRAVRALAPEAILVCDAVQAAPRIPLEPEAVDLLTLSGHKLHGPPGVGALVRLRPVPLEALVVGGQQEGGVRAGTENVALIVGMGAALRMVTGRTDAIAARLRDLETVFLDALRECGCDFTEVTDPRLRAPGMLCLSFPQMEADDLVIAADLAGVAISAGSACRSGTPEPSHVLTAMGIERAAARHVIRVAFHRDQQPSAAQEAARRLAGISNRSLAP